MTHINSDSASLSIGQASPRCSPIETEPHKSPLISKTTDHLNATAFCEAIAEHEQAVQPIHSVSSETMENINLPHEQIANSECKVDIASTVLPALEELAMLPLDEASELHFETPALHPESHDKFSKNHPSFTQKLLMLHPEIPEICLVCTHYKSHDKPSSPLWETNVFLSDLQHLQYDRPIEHYIH